MKAVTSQTLSSPGRGRRYRLILPIVAFAILLLMVAALGAGAAPAPRHRAAPIPPPAPAPVAPAEPQHTTLDFQQENEDSIASDEDSASSAGSAYWVKRRGGNGDLVRFGEDVTVPAGRTVLGDVVAVGGDITVLGTVNGDAVAVGGSVHLRPGGVVRGETISIGGRVLNDTGQGLHGSSVSLPSIPKWLFDFNVMNIIGQGLALVKILFTILLAAAAAWAVNALALERTERAVAHVRAAPGHSFLWGIGTLIGIAPSAVAVALFSALLCITLIGIPVAILLLAAYVVALILLVMWGFLVGAALVGRWVWRRFRPLEPEPVLLKAMLAGIVALAVPGFLGHLLRTVMFMVPPVGALGIAIWVLGCLLTLSFWLVGMGALIATRAGMPPRIVPAGGIVPPPPGTPTMPPPPAMPPTIPPSSGLPPASMPPPGPIDPAPTPPATA
jgi:hypothetical protein